MDRLEPILLSYPTRCLLLESPPFRIEILKEPSLSSADVNDESRSSFADPKIEGDFAREQPIKYNPNPLDIELRLDFLRHFHLDSHGQQSQYHPHPDCTPQKFPDPPRTTPNFTLDPPRTYLDPSRLPQLLLIFHRNTPRRPSPPLHRRPPLHPPKCLLRPHLPLSHPPSPRRKRRFRLPTSRPGRPHGLPQKTRPAR